MSEFVKILLSLSVAGTLLLLLILGLKPLYKNRFSRRWQYYIWIIAALRFLLPFTPDTTLVGWLFERIPTAATAGEDRADSGDPLTWHGSGETDRAQTNQSENTAPVGPISAGSASVKSASVGSVLSDSVSVEPALNKPAPVGSEHSDPALGGFELSAPVPAGSVFAGQMPTEPLPAALHLPDAYVCLFFIWLAAALALFTCKIAMYQGFLRRLKAGSTEASDPKALRLLADCRERLGIKTRVRLLRNEWIGSPIMTGFFRPSIILPAEELEERELFFVFEHELHHYKQGDMLYKWLIQIVACVHWFNPFVYLLEKEVNRACELACDEAVIAGLDDHARREYGDTLLLFSRAGNCFKNTLASIAMSEGAKHLKERLGAITSFKKRSKKIVAASLMAALLLSVEGVAVGASAAQPKSNDPEEPAIDAAAPETDAPTTPDEISSTVYIAEGKAAADVEALIAVIQEQNAQGAKLPTDLNDTKRYVWDEEGNLTEIWWRFCSLNGSLSLEGFASLTRLECGWNQLSGLDISGCPALEQLECRDNQLSSLNVSGCTALMDLNCYKNQLVSLDVSGCPALEYLDCQCNQLSSLDVGRNKALTDLYCSSNELVNLNVSGCTALVFLGCAGNPMSSLDVNGCTALVDLICPYIDLSSLDISGCPALDAKSVYGDKNLTIIR